MSDIKKKKEKVKAQDVDKPKKKRQPKKVNDVKPEENIVIEYPVIMDDKNTVSDNNNNNTVSDNNNTVNDNIVIDNYNEKDVNKLNNIYNDNYNDDDYEYVYENGDEYNKKIDESVKFKLVKDNDNIEPFQPQQPLFDPDTIELKDRKTNHTIESLSLEITNYLKKKHDNITYEEKVRQLQNVLMICAKNGDLKTVKILLANNVDINTHDYDSLTPLMAAIINHNTEMVKFLLEYNANPNICDNEGWSPLMIAIANNNYKVNNVIRDNTTIINMLLEFNADIHHKNDSGYTPTIISAMNGELDIMKLLVKNGTSIDEKDNEDISVFAHAVMFTGRNRNIEKNTNMLDYLVENNANIHQSNINNQSALFLAAHNGYFDMVKYCVDHGIDFKQRDVNGVTPFEQAYERGHKRITNYLADKMTTPMVNV